MPARAHQPDGSQYPQVLGHRWLSKAEPHHDIAHRALLAGQVAENLAAARFGDGVEGISRCRCSWHWTKIYIPMQECVKCPPA